MVSVTASTSASFDPTVPYCVRLDGDGQFISHGRFFPDGEISLGKFLWSMVLRLQGESGDLLADGYAGAHCILIQAASRVIAGNFNTNSAGSTSISFGSDYTLAADEWALVSVSWDGAAVRVYVNGVCCGKVAHAGTRYARSHSNGNGHLFVGSSGTHAYMQMDVAHVSGFDRDFLPHDGVPDSAIWADRQPARWASNGSSVVAPADFYCDYTVPRVLSDVSARGVSHTVTAADRTFHHGRLLSENGGTVTDGFEGGPFTTPLPTWVESSNCPFGRDYSCPKPTTLTRSPVAVPGDSPLIWDSFGREDQTPYWDQTPTLGSTEGGSRGALAWESGIVTGYAYGSTRAPWGIMQGSAVMLARVPVTAWVEAGTASQDVRVKRSLNTWNPGSTGVTFRQTDRNNWWAAYWLGPEGGNKIYVQKCVAGSVTAVTSYATGTSHTHIRAHALGTTLTFYTGLNGVWTQVGQLTGQTDLQTATKAGLAGTPGFSLYSSLARYQQFAVYTAA